LAESFVIIPCLSVKIAYYREHNGYVTKKYLSPPDKHVSILSTCRDEIIQDFKGAKFFKIIISSRLCLPAFWRGVKKVLCFFVKFVLNS